MRSTPLWTNQNGEKITSATQLLGSPFSKDLSKRRTSAHWWALGGQRGRPIGHVPTALSLAGGLEGQHVSVLQIPEAERRARSVPRGALEVSGADGGLAAQDVDG